MAGAATPEAVQAGKARAAAERAGAAMPGAWTLAAMKSGAIPTRYDDPAAWTGAEMRGRDDWILQFGEADLAELEAALEATRRLPIERIGAHDFALPTLGPRLTALRDEIVEGRGFALLRGFEVEGRPIEDTARAFWGIGAWLGRAVSQNAMGHVLGHVCNLFDDPNDPDVRTYRTTERQYYHADSCDIVGLLCLRPAKRGGLSSIVSSVTVYNEMARRHPEFAAVLSEPIPIDRRGEVPEGEEPFFLNAAFNHHEGLLSSYYNRRYMESSQRHPHAPRLTPLHHVAFDLVDRLVEDPDLHLNMAFAPGDIQFLHNHTMLHDRTAFEDWPEPERKRHLLRLWLSPPNGRPLPERYAARWGSVKPGERGGVFLPGARLRAPLEPE